MPAYLCCCRSCSIWLICPSCSAASCLAAVRESLAEARRPARAAPAGRLVHCIVQTGCMQGPALLPNCQRTSHMLDVQQYFNPHVYTGQSNCLQAPCVMGSCARCRGRPWRIAAKMSFSAHPLHPAAASAAGPVRWLPHPCATSPLPSAPPREPAQHAPASQACAGT